MKLLDKLIILAMALYICLNDTGSWEEPAGWQLIVILPVLYALGYLMSRVYDDYHQNQ